MNAYAVVNPRAARPDEPYGPERSRVLSAEGFVAAASEIATWPGYAPTPLVALPGLARRLGLGTIFYKDERSRFGLKSFKALGGAYAVLRVLQQRLAAAGHGAVSSRDLVAGAHRDLVAGVTVTCATDGNHGRSVAWGAQLFGCRCVIYVHETVSQGRRDAIARYGADVVEVAGNYDDAVRHAAATAAAQGWTVVSDTSYPGYRDIPTDVMHGYGVMAGEIAAQLATRLHPPMAEAPSHAPADPRRGEPIQPPTHVFAQAGVGAMAAAICADFWQRWGAQRPRFVIVEPIQADCVTRSLAAGVPTVVPGALDTVMAGLACGEVSELAWTILAQGANAAVAIPDDYALAAVRAFAAPTADDPPIVAGETGAAGLAALLAAQDDPELLDALALDASSRVLLVGSEGDTDAAIYADIVGRSGDAVLATSAGANRT